mmetsp:Transcript_3778/g.507  ORF Transcript_3778/g.507 Transcript_3778/m.507 type:complete len:85 (-) Transcript_3778:243-497(-)
MHSIINPLTFVGFPIFPLVYTLSLYLIVFESSCVVRPISKFQLSIAIFQSELILAVVVSAILPYFLTMPVLFVSYSLSYIFYTV